MKREETSSQSYIDWLKSLGCVFYAPLSNGDLSDNISNQILSLSNGTVTWDANQNAYKFQGPSSINNYIASWQTLNMDIDTNNINLTICYEVYANNKSVIPIVFKDRNFAQSINYAGTQTYTWMKLATTFPAFDGVNPVIQQYYVNGNITATTNRGQNPGTIADIAKYGVECNNAGSYNTYINKTYYMRNAMIFNKILTQQQIKEVQE